MGLFCRSVALKLSACSQNSCRLSTRFLFLFFPLFSASFCSAEENALWTAPTYSLTSLQQRDSAAECYLLAVNLCYSQKQHLRATVSSLTISTHTLRCSLTSLVCFSAAISSYCAALCFHAKHLHKTSWGGTRWAYSGFPRCITTTAALLLFYFQIFFWIKTKARANRPCSLCVFPLKSNRHAENGKKSICNVQL